MEKRSQDFLDDKMRFSMILDLIQTEKIRNEFEKKVIGDTNIQVEKEIDNLIDWMISKNSKLWRDTMEYFQQKVTINSADIVGKVKIHFDYNRQDLLKTIGLSTANIINSFNKTQESLKLSEDIKKTLLSTGIKYFMNFLNLIGKQKSCR